MRLVIEISESVYKRVKDMFRFSDLKAARPLTQEVVRAIATGEKEEKKDE